MTVYADVLFLVNFSLDYVTLYITGRLMSLSSSLARTVAASGLGAAFAVSALIFDMRGAVYAFASAVVTVLMCICAFKRAGRLAYASAAILMFSVGSAIGGAVTAICSVGVGYRDGIEADAMQDAAVFAVAAIASVLTAISARAAKSRRTVGKRRVTVAVRGSSVTLDALTDSGSLLREPISARPVLVVRADALSGVVPDCVLGASKNPTPDVTSIDSGELSRVRLIPVEGVTGRAILLGYRPDAVEIDGRCTDCIIALKNEKNGFGGCDAILPSELI